MVASGPQGLQVRLAHVATARTRAVAGRFARHRGPRPEPFPPPPPAPTQIGASAILRSPNGEITSTRWATATSSAGAPRANFRAGRREDPPATQPDRIWRRPVSSSGIWALRTALPERQRNLRADEARRRREVVIGTSRMEFRIPADNPLNQERRIVHTISTRAGRLVARTAARHPSSCGIRSRT